MIGSKPQKGGIQKPADPLYDKAKCAAGESMADASSMVGQQEGAYGGDHSQTLQPRT